MQCRGRVFRFLSQGLDLEGVCVCVCVCACVCVCGVVGCVVCWCGCVGVCVCVCVCVCECVSVCECWGVCAGSLSPLSWPKAAPWPAVNLRGTQRGRRML